MARRFLISKLTGWTELDAGAELRTTFYVYDTLHACANVAEFSVRGKNPRRVAGALYSARATQRRLENDWALQCQ